jgi:hypothetical protein
MLTESEAAFGGLTTPFVRASHMPSPGMSASVQKIVKRGESQRTIDEGSSYLMRRLSNLE